MRGYDSKSRDKIWMWKYWRNTGNMSQQKGIAKLQVEPASIDLVMTKEREKEREDKFKEFKKNRMGNI